MFFLYLLSSSLNETLNAHNVQSEQTKTSPGIFFNSYTKFYLGNEQHKIRKSLHNGWSLHKIRKYQRRNLTSMQNCVR